MFQKFNEDTQSLQSFLLIQSEKDKREVYFINKDGDLTHKNFNEYMYKGSNPKCMNSVQVNTQVMSNVKGSSAVDINNDCIPDLVLETVDTSASDNKNYLEFYLATNEGYCLVDNRNIKDDYLMASFSDLSSSFLPDNDGTNDMILVSKSLMVDIFLNKFQAKSDPFCETNDDLSNPYSGFGNHDVDNLHFVFQLTGITGNIYINNDLPGTGVVRMGDLELDGYQDIVLTITGSDNTPKSIFFENVACPESVTKTMTTGGSPVDFSKCRYFQRVKFMGKVESLTSYSTSFFDYHELG